MSAAAPDSGVAAEVERQVQALRRGAVQIVSEEQLRRKLERSIVERRPLRVKLGVDPTSSMLHLGFTVVLNKLRAFQDLGHQAVLIIGDATALVGDPTGRNKTRPRLTADEVAQNAETYLEQAGRVLDLGRTELRRNSEWLAKLGFEGMVALAARYTVARLLERDDFSKRFKDGIAIHVHELLYPLLQGWDSVMVRSDVELGGTDQLFNLLVGRDLQEQEGQEPQVCLTTPLLIGLDGQQKMSKSYGNTVGITEAASEMAIKIMRLDDALMRDWFLLVTRLPEPEIGRILAPGRNPRDAKLDLARAIAAMYHGPADAEAAVAGWLRVVSEHALPENIPELRFAVPDGSAPSALDYLMATGWTASKSEARRWISEGSVRFDDEKVTDPKASIPYRAGIIVRHGKQHIAKTAGPS